MRKLFKLIYTKKFNNNNNIEIISTKLRVIAYNLHLLIIIGVKHIKNDYFHFTIATNNCNPTIRLDKKWRVDNVLLNCSFI